MATAGESPGLKRLRLQDEIRDHPGMQALNRIRRMERSRKVLVVNGRELRKALEYMADPARSFHLWDVNRRGELQELQDEISRFLHNFLASAKTLVDHTRRVLEDAYKGTPLWADYTAEVMQHFAEGSPVFVQDLRNYTLHRNLAEQFARLTYTAEAEDFETGISLSRDDLLRWENWRAPARAWLEQQPESIDFLVPLTEYEEAVIALHSWVNKAIRAEHADDIARVEGLIRQFQASLPRIT